MWARIQNILRLLMPQIVMVGLVMLTFARVPVSGMELIRPPFILMAIYYWSIYRPTMVPPVLCFVLGLLVDLLMGTSPGLNALMFVAVQWLIRDQRRFLRGQPYIAIWGVFGMVVLAVMAVQAGLTALTGGAWPPLLPAALTWAASLCIFPFVSLLLLGTHRLLPVATRAFS